MCKVPVPSRRAYGRLLSALCGRMSELSGAQIVEVATWIYTGGGGEGAGAKVVKSSDKIQQ